MSQFGHKWTFRFAHPSEQIKHSMRTCDHCLVTCLYICWKFGDSTFKICILELEVSCSIVFRCAEFSMLNPKSGEEDPMKLDKGAKSMTSSGFRGFGLWRLRGAVRRRRHSLKVSSRWMIWWKSSRICGSCKTSLSLISGLDFRDRKMFEGDSIVISNALSLQQGAPNAMHLPNRSKWENWFWIAGSHSTTGKVCQSSEPHKEPLELMAKLCWQFLSWVTCASRKEGNLNTALWHVCALCIIIMCVDNVCSIIEHTAFAIAGSVKVQVFHFALLACAFKSTPILSGGPEQRFDGSSTWFDLAWPMWWTVGQFLPEMDGLLLLGHHILHDKHEIEHLHRLSILAYLSVSAGSANFAFFTTKPFVCGF